MSYILRYFSKSGNSVFPILKTWFLSLPYTDEVGGESKDCILEPDEETVFSQVTANCYLVEKVLSLIQGKQFGSNFSSFCKYDEQNLNFNSVTFSFSFYFYQS